MAESNYGTDTAQDDSAQSIHIEQGYHSSATNRASHQRRGQSRPYSLRGQNHRGVGRSSRGRILSRPIPQSAEQITQKILDIHSRDIPFLRENHENMIAEKYSSLDQIDENDESIMMKAERIKELEDQLRTFNVAIESYCTVDFLELPDPQGHMNGLIRETNRLKNRLPIYARRQDLIKKIQSNRVIILKADTGSGKSTQLVQYLYDAGLADHAQIVCTQPRRLAARALAARVAEEFGCKLGEEVGYHIGGSKPQVSERTRIRFVTDAVLLNEYHDDPMLRAYSIIIIDEAHERRVDTDLLFGVMKICLKQRQDIKLIVMSATLDENLLSQYYDNAGVIKVPGRTFPIEDEYATEDPDDYVDAAIAKTLEIHASKQPGDILIFLTGPDEINRAIEETRRKIKPPDSARILPLHGKLNDNETQEVFKSAHNNRRKIIFATNIAETSITIDGIRHVIDSGMAKEVMWDPKRNMRALKIDYITQSSIQQRRGRAGRTAAGTCYHLYTLETYDSLNICPRAEILCIQPSIAVLKLKYLGIKNVLSFDWLQAPNATSLRDAVVSLTRLQALDSTTEEVTDLGRTMARLNLDPMLSAMILAGKKYDCLSYVIALAGMLNILQNLWWRGKDDASKQKSDAVRASFSCDADVGGDHIVLLRIYLEWNALEKNYKTQNEWCHEHMISLKSMNMADNFIREIVYLIDPKFKIEFDVLNIDLIKRILHCIYAGFFQQVAVSNGNLRAGYLIMNDSMETWVRIYRSSTLTFIQQPPQYVIYHDILVINEINYLTAACPIDLDWIDRSGFHSVPRPLSEYKLSSYVFKDIGPALMLSVVGKKCRNIPNLNQAFCIFVDADYEQSTLTIWGRSESICTAKGYFQELLAHERVKLGDEVQEFQIVGSTRILLGAGAQTKSVMVDDEYVRILIAGLPTLITEQQIEEKCSRYGRVRNITIIQSNQTGSSALVTYDKCEHAQRAVTELGRQILSGKEIKVNPSYIRTSVHASRQNCTLKAQWFMTASKCSGRVQYSEKEAAKRANEFFKRERHYFAQLLPNSSNPTIKCSWPLVSHTGSATVKFKTSEQAQEALRSNTPRPFRVDVDKKSNVGIYLKNVPRDFDEDDIRKIFPNSTKISLYQPQNGAQNKIPIGIEDDLCRLFYGYRSFQRELVLVSPELQNGHIEAYVQFSDEQEMKDAINTMNGKVNPVVLGKLKLAIHEPNEKQKTTMKKMNKFNKVTKSGFVINLSRLPPHVDEEVLMEDLNTHNCGDYLQSVIVFRNNLSVDPCTITSDDTTGEDKRNRDKLQSLFADRNRFRCIPDINIPPASKDGRVVAYVLFNDPRDVITAMDMYGPSKDSNLLKFGEFKIYLIPVVDHNIELNSALAQAIPKKVQNAIDTIKNHPKLSGIVLLKKVAFKSENEILRISIKGRNIEQIHQARTIFDDLMKGSIYKFEQTSWVSIIFSVTGKKFLQELQNRTGTYIWWHWKTACLRIFGEEQACKNVQQELDSYIRKTISQNNQKVHIKIPDGCLRQCMQKSSEILELADENVNITINVVKRIILLEGERQATSPCEQKVKDLLSKLVPVSNQSATTTRISEKDKCSICLCPFVSPYSLQQCGHKFCRSCLINYFEDYFNTIIASTALELCCPFEKCHKRCCIRDIMSILGHEKMANLAMIAYRTHIQYQRNNLLPCIRDNCEQVYRPSNHSSTYFCDQCMEIYCIPCKVEYHIGFTCEQYQKMGRTQQSTTSLEANASTLPSKNCPQCRTAVVKKDNGNALKCPQCSIAFCWLCPLTDTQNVSFHYGDENSPCYARFFDFD